MPAPTAPGAMYDSTSQAFEQSFQVATSLGLSTMRRSEAGDANVAEQTRLGFLEMKTGSDIANDILNQRSVQQQPQQGVIAKV